MFLIDLKKQVTRIPFQKSKKKKSKFVDASINYSILGSLRKKRLKKLIIAHLNINSLRNKFEFLVDQIKGKVDLLMVSETRLDESFAQGQFKISGFSRPFRLDRNSNGGGIMLFVREDIPAKLIFTEVSPIEGFYVEIILTKQKWLICCSYNPCKHNIREHIEALRKSVDLFSSN